MIRKRSTIVVAVALAHSAEVTAWQVTVTGEEKERIDRTLRNLLDLGHVATFSIRGSSTVNIDQILEGLRARIGGIIVDACSSSPERQEQQEPAFLMPVWPFDHLVSGAPAATGKLLGLDLKLFAFPSADEERGANLPGRQGRWLILAHA